jgi:ribosome-associated translation inhibitor RaiA
MSFFILYYLSQGIKACYYKHLRNWHIKNVGCVTRRKNFNVVIRLVLGKLSIDKLYGGTARLGLESDGRDLSTAIKTAFSYLPTNIYRHQEKLPKNTTANNSSPAELKAIKNYTYHLPSKNKTTQTYNLF